MSDWYKDAMHKLEYADYKIKKLKEEIDNDDFLEKRFIKNEINDILGNIRPPLDYFAKYIARNIGSKAQSPAFPFATSEADFKNKYWKHIAIKSEKLANHFRTVQKYNGCTWLAELNKMNNNEKHQEINKQEVEVEENVPYMNIGGNHFYNTTFRGNAKNVVIQSNGVEKELDISRIPGYNKKYIYIFKYNEKEVFECLSEFQRNTLKFVQ